MTYKERIYDSLFNKYFIFTGRASRADFLSLGVVALVIELFSSIEALAVTDDSLSLYIFVMLMNIVSTVLYIPMMSLTIRRLHDSGNGVLDFLWMIIPIIGHFFFLYLLLKKGDEGTNEYGLPPESEVNKTPSFVEQFKEIWAVFIQCITKKLFQYKGRAPRKEFWSVAAILTCLMQVLSIVISIAYILGMLQLAMSDPSNNLLFYHSILAQQIMEPAVGFVLITFICSFLLVLSVTVRRLHDLNLTGFYAILMLIPIAQLWIGYKALKVGTMGDNQYGPDPLDPEDERYLV